MNRLNRGHLRLVRPTDPSGQPPTDEQLARAELIRHLPGALRHAQGDSIMEMYLEMVRDYLYGMERLIK